jgi:hypothetical protein
MGRGSSATQAHGQALLYGSRHRGQRPQLVEPWFDLDDNQEALLARFKDIPATDPGVPVDDRGMTMHYVYAYPNLQYDDEFLSHFIVVAVGTRYKRSQPTASFGSALYGRRIQDGKLETAQPFYLGDQQLGRIIRHFNNTRSRLVATGWTGQAVVTRDEIDASISRYLGRALGTVRTVKHS